MIKNIAAAKFWTCAMLMLSDDIVEGWGGIRRLKVSVCEMGAARGGGGTRRGEKRKRDGDMDEMGWLGLFSRSPNHTPRKTSESGF
jgi:hypothetical protein